MGAERITAGAGAESAKRPLVPEPARWRVWLGSNRGDVNRGIGILPMMPLDHGQDARATFLPKRCADFKPLHRRRLTGRADGRFPHNTLSYWGGNRAATQAADGWASRPYRGRMR